MREYVTESIVLAVLPNKEYDLMVDLYTKDLGRVKARAISGRKILSKFSPHLNSLNLTSVRLVEKKQFTITDILTMDNFPSLRGNSENYSLALNLLNVIKILAPFSVPDAHLWHFLRYSFSNNSIDLNLLLKILGYSHEFAECALCFQNKIAHFSVSNQIFLCSPCNAKMKDMVNSLEIRNS